jgi:hypothetical protein
LPRFSSNQSLPCGLCLESKPLVSSHLIPAAYYRQLRVSERQNPNPVLVGDSSSTITSGQVKETLLCSACEQLFNTRGERWVIQNGFRGENEFRAQKLLRKSEPLHTLREVTIYPGRRIQGFDLDALIYFATSVYWRAGARRWWLHDHHGQLDLGPYQEWLRLFLLGDGEFPNDAVAWVSVAASVKPENVVVFPYGGSRDGFHLYEFSVPGLAFHLFLGKRIPDEIRSLCAVRSAEGYTCLSSNVDLASFRAMVKKIPGTRPTGSLVPLHSDPARSRQEK